MSPGGAWRGNRRTAIALVVLLLAAVGPLVGNFSAQPSSRYALTAALAEHRSVDLAPYRRSLGVDRAEIAGKLRSDKAPGQPFLGVPVYVVGRALGAEPATELRWRGDLGLWWQTLWSAMLPFAALVALVFLVCTQFARRRAALAIAGSLAFGTMLLPHAVNLYAHVLTALLAFGAWLVLEGADLRPRHAFAGGALAAAAVAVEYDAGIVLIVLAGFVLWRGRERLAWFAAGAAGPFAFLALYQSVAFGAPWRTPSSFYAGTIEGTSEGGYSVPSLHDLSEVLFGRRGLWVGAPIALVAIPVAVWLARRGADQRVRMHATVALAVTVPFLVLTAGWSGLPILEEPGPRYVIPALPFLAVPLAVAWSRAGRLAAVASGWGALIAIPAATTYILLGIGENPLPALPGRVLDGKFLPTLWSMGFGRAGAALHALSVMLAAAFLVRCYRRDAAHETGDTPATVAAAA